MNWRVVRTAVLAAYAQLEDESLAALPGVERLNSTVVLLESDLILAEQVITADEQFDVLRNRCEEQAFRLLSLQAPSRATCGWW